MLIINTNLKSELICFARKWLNFSDFARFHFLLNQLFHVLEILCILLLLPLLIGFFILWVIDDLLLFDTRLERRHFFDSSLIAECFLLAQPLNCEHFRSSFKVVGNFLLILLHSNCEYHMVIEGLFQSQPVEIDAPKLVLGILSILKIVNDCCLEKLSWALLCFAGGKLFAEGHVHIGVIVVLEGLLSFDFRWHVWVEVVSLRIKLDLLNFNLWTRVNNLVWDVDILELWCLRWIHLGELEATSILYFDIITSFA